MARAGFATTLSVDSTTKEITTLDVATINFSYGCASWASGGTVQLYIEGSTPTNIGSPVTIPDISLTSNQFSGSVTHKFATAGTYVINAKVQGTLDGGGASVCDVAAINSGTPVTIVVTAGEAPTITNKTPNTGINAGVLVAFASLLLASGAVLVSRRRLS